MPLQSDLDRVYIQTAELHAGLSKALRKGVGACLVTKQGVTLTGYNGTPAGLSNECEDKVYNLNTDNFDLVTKPTVVHAEVQTILKAAREGVSCIDSTLYVTLSPCQSCSAMLIQAGIKRVVFKEHYRDSKGLDLLQEAGIITELFNTGDHND